MIEDVEAGGSRSCIGGPRSPQIKFRDSCESKYFLGGVKILIGKFTIRVVKTLLL